MKKFIVIITVLFFTSSTYAQNALNKTDDAGRIVLNTYIPEDGNIKPAAFKIFETRLNAITSANGLGGSGMFQRFVISGKVNELSKNIVVGPPDQIVLELEVSFVIADAIDGTVFSTESLTFQSIGDNETKAYIDALKKIKPSDKKIQAFIELGKNKIIEYYNSKCDFILKQATTLANQKEYDNALYNLAEVPEVCKSCYDKSMDLSVKIYNDKMENECQKNISLANSLIATDQWDEAAKNLSFYTPDMKCYAEIKVLLAKIADHRCAVSLGKAKGAWASKDIETTSMYLSEIAADSKCNDEAQKIAIEVRAWAKEKDGREWKLELKKQSDDVELKKRAISAARDVGVAYGKNQPKVVYNTRVIRTWW
jgi:hypothetical protein